MAIFESVDIGALSEGKRKKFARYELILTFLELVGGVMFIIGSFLFLNESTTLLGTYFFIVGSFFFVLRPTVKFIREFHRFRNNRY
ncbi:YrhK family protein [Mollicutes bacterium LVI A0078]|nr:YrhK family protein [Mollicutes bacterium LVI A0075]WOO91570.1 YrhK family protein [Mollicutes bacterium LVI A0078]